MPFLQAADSKTEEAAIRAAIASGQAKPTDDEIIWTGAYKRPFIRPEKGEEFPGHELKQAKQSKDDRERAADRGGGPGRVGVRVFLWDCGL